MGISLSRFVNVSAQTITRVYTLANRNYVLANRAPWCAVARKAPVITPVSIWFPLTTGPGVMIKDASASKYVEELDEQLGSLFRQYVRANGGEVKDVPARLVSLTRSPFGLQIPNPDPPEIIEWKSIAGASTDRIPVGMSFDSYGESLEWWDRNRDPHAIVAGATGSGKSKAMQSMIAQLVANESPEDLEIVPIDLKRRALVELENAPHVRVPLAYKKESAVAMLMALDAEQDRRIEGLIDHPAIVLVIDELTDVLQGDKEAQETFSRITRKGRELGIFVIAGTQKPMLTGEGQGIGQLTFKLVGRMNKDREAKLVADEEISRLMHSGSFYIVTGRGEPVAVRVPFISDARFAGVMADAKRRWSNPSPSALVLPEVGHGTTGKAIAKANARREQAAINLQRLQDAFGEELPNATMRQMILALGLSPNGNSYYRSEKIVSEALELLESGVCYGVTYVT